MFTLGKLYMLLRPLTLWADTKKEAHSSHQAFTEYGHDFEAGSHFMLVEVRISTQKFFSPSDPELQRFRLKFLDSNGILVYDWMSKYQFGHYFKECGPP